MKEDEDTVPIDIDDTNQVIRTRHSRRNLGDTTERIIQPIRPTAPKPPDVPPTGGRERGGIDVEELPPAPLPVAVHVQRPFVTAFLVVLGAGAGAFLCYLAWLSFWLWWNLG